MITSECVLYCYKSFIYFDRVFLKDKKYSVTKDDQFIGKNIFLMISENKIRLSFEINSNFEKRIMKKYFYTENQARKKKLLKLQKL